MYEVLHFNPKIMEQPTSKQCICVRVDYSVFFFRDKFIPSDTDQHKEKKSYIHIGLFINEQFFKELIDLNI